jgi:hypothetical protein
MTSEIYNKNSPNNPKINLKIKINNKIYSHYNHNNNSLQPLDFADNVAKFHNK